jgi:hypothetical protein
MVIEAIAQENVGSVFHFLVNVSPFWFGKESEEIFFAQLRD